MTEIKEKEKAEGEEDICTVYSHPSHLNIALRSLIFLMVIYQYKRSEVLGTVYGMAKENCVSRVLSKAA